MRTSCAQVSLSRSHQIDFLHLDVDHITVTFGQNGNVGAGDEARLPVGDDAHA